MYTRGFTLIELLVVIAIIGLLASIVLASLNTARDQSKDAAIQSDLHGVQAQAEVIRGSSPCYLGASGTCAGSAATIGNTTDAGGCVTNQNLLCSNSVVLAQVRAANAAGGFVSLKSSAGARSYAYAVQLATDPAWAWCVDSTGQAKSVLLATEDQAGVNGAISTDIVSGNVTCNP